MQLLIVFKLVKKRAFIMLVKVKMSAAQSEIMNIDLIKHTIKN